MSTTGSLTDFSLIEIFQFLEKGHKTGLLTLRVLPESQVTLPPVHYFWVYQGQVVAAANQLDQQGLVSLIEQHQWVSPRVLARLEQFCPIDQPLGLCLKNQGILQSEQLKHLFHVQVVQRVCTLCQLKDGQFKFEQDVPIPVREMTGFSVPAGVLKFPIKAVKHVQHIVGQLQLKLKALHCL